MKKYIRTWLMEPLAPALLAALVPSDVKVAFYDDRLELIPFDNPTNLVAISVETYTARRAYQIATEYRRRGVPVVMGGFHATLCPDEVMQHAESIVIGEAEELFPQVIDDYRHGTPARRYDTSARPQLGVKPRRSIYAGKVYLPIRLVEYSRGCRFKCDFCAVQSFFSATHSHQPIGQVLREIQETRDRRTLYFFIDDNICSDLEAAKDLFKALIPLHIRWVSQSSINVAFDDEALQLLKASGCQCLLVGIESLQPNALAGMNKSFNLMRGGPEVAMSNLRKFGIRVYGTFMFGYDNDNDSSFKQSVEFAKQQEMFIAAFNHVTPFPGTPLYRRLETEGRLLFDAWWNDSGYSYNMVPFEPVSFSPKELSRKCVLARRSFYSLPSIAKRALGKANRGDLLMLARYFIINAMHRSDISGRNGLPLGDAAWKGPFLPIQVPNRSVSGYSMPIV
jgi:radical SAM superfamily enzyme YgiQ (UPF0313 family)